MPILVVFVYIINNLYAVIIVVTHYGMSTAGEFFILECYVNSSISFQWLDSNGTPVVNNDSVIITHSAIQSQLQFFPLCQSHTGPMHVLLALVGVQN